MKNPRVPIPVGIHPCCTLPLTLSREGHFSLPGWPIAKPSSTSIIISPRLLSSLNLNPNAHIDPFHARYCQLPYLHFEQSSTVLAHTRDDAKQLQKYGPWAGAVQRLRCGAADMRLSRVGREPPGVHSGDVWHLLGPRQVLQLPSELKPTPIYIH